MKRLGVVAGVGPFAGLDFQQKLLESTRAGGDQEHLDVIAWYQSSAIADRTAFLEGRVKTNPGCAIAEQAVELERAGASVLAIPCNTAHAAAIFDTLRARLADARSSLLMLDMIAEVAAHLETSGHQRIGLLATTGTVKHRVYADHPAFKGLEVLTPHADLQRQVHSAIYCRQHGLKVHGRATSVSRRWLDDAAADLMHQGASVLILGCTELPLALHTDAKLFGEIPSIDAGLLLARAAVREIAPNQLRPMAKDGALPVTCNAVDCACTG